MKVLLRFLALMTGLVVTMVGTIRLQEFCAEIRDRSSNQRAYETLVRPSVQWIRDFRKIRERFPTRDELAVYATTNGTIYSLIFFDSPQDWQSSWGDLGVDFMVLCQHRRVESLSPIVGRRRMEGVDRLD